MKHGDIYLNKSPEGFYHVDVTGLLYILKNKIVPVGSTVLGVLPASTDWGLSENERVYLDTYEVCASDGNHHILNLVETDWEEELSQLNDLPGTQVAFYDAESGEQVNQDELENIFGLSSEDFADLMDGAMDDLSPFLELDEVMMDAEYYVYPPGTDGHQSSKAAEQPERFEIIHYEEALHRMKHGEEVYVEKDETFTKKTNEDALTPDLLLEHTWATSNRVKGIKTKEEKDIHNPINDIEGSLEERLSDYLYEGKVTEKEMSHDLDVLNLLQEIRDLLKDEED